MFSIFKKKTNAITDISWLGVDIHNHLLPGIDDGSKTIEESIDYITRLNNLGFHKFICTPHIFTELYPNTPETINSALTAVSVELKKTKPSISIFAAAEYMIDDTFKSLTGLMTLPGNYLLIEMSYLNETPNIEQVIFDLQIKGYSIILAHPERYNFYHKEQGRYHRLKDMGCLFQLNLLAIVGYYGKDVKQMALHLLKQNLYDLAGTDLHHDKHLKVLENSVESGVLYQTLGNYPFKNRAIFGN